MRYFLQHPDPIIVVIRCGSGMQRHARRRERLVRVHEKLRRLPGSENLAKGGAGRVQLDQALDERFYGRQRVVVRCCASGQ
jgi:hypothetical protein